MTALVLAITLIACSGPTSQAVDVDPVSDTPTEGRALPAGKPVPAAPASPATQPSTETAPPATATPAAAVSDRSIELNTQGYRAYKSGDLVEAARLFRAAVDADDDNALAHYNLACTLALLRRTEPACEHDATQVTILDHLARAIELDDGRRTRMRQDADLDDLRDLLRFRILDQGMPTTDAATRSLLSGVTLWAPAAGIYGATGTLALQADGSVTVTRRVLEGGTVVDRSEPDGRWSVEARTVLLELGDDRQELILDATGVLTAGDTALWSGHSPECSA